MVFEVVVSEKYPELDKFFKTSFNELKDFFNCNWKYDTPSLFLINKRKEMDLIQHEKTPSWVIATTKKDLIFIFSPQSFEKESCHHYSKESYYSTIKHELVHTITGKMSKYQYKPLWFSEGIAIFVSGQNNFKKMPEKFLSFLDSHKESVYDESGFAIELLVKNYGKTKLLQLIKLWGKCDNEKDFNKAFNIIYKFTPKYEIFNKMLKK
ncbi:MAG: hypothetical protein PHN56_02000 [Candidatus Nanoarchaeia archaeon]|nr:hypothetical protein [Candidatus Nanoarchaeia archaeon]